MSRRSVVGWLLFVVALPLMFLAMSWKSEFGRSVLVLVSLYLMTPIAMSLIRRLTGRDGDPRAHRVGRDAYLYSRMTLAQLLCGLAAGMGVLVANLTGSWVRTVSLVAAGLGVIGLVVVLVLTVRRELASPS